MVTTNKGVGYNVAYVNLWRTSVTTQIVILAAGMGSRLGRSLPKPLTELSDGRTIMGQQFDNVRYAFGRD